MAIGNRGIDLGLSDKPPSSIVAPKNKGVGIKGSPSQYYETYILPNGEEVDTVFLDGKTIIPPDKAKLVLTDFIETQFNNYVEDAFNKTCTNIDNTIDDFKVKLDKRNGEKITQMAEDIFNSLKTKDVELMVEKVFERKYHEILENKLAELLTDGRLDSKINEMLNNLKITL